MFHFGRFRSFERILVQSCRDVSGMDVFAAITGNGLDLDFGRTKDDRVREDIHVPPFDVFFRAKFSEPFLLEERQTV
jgi:hypothetical protein